MEFEELPYSIKAVLSFNDPFTFLSTKNNAAFSFILYSVNNRNTFLQKINQATVADAFGCHIKMEQALKAHFSQDHPSSPYKLRTYKDKTYEKIISNIQEIKSRKGKIIVITDSKNDKVLKELSNDLIVVPKTNHYAFVILASIVLQLLAYHIALGKKLNVDQPRNLAKSVSVE